MTELRKAAGQIGHFVALNANLGQLIFGTLILTDCALTIVAVFSRGDA